MLLIPLPHLLIFSSLLFVIGIYGTLVRRSVIGILIAIELILNACTVNFVVFSRTTSLSPETGQMVALFIIATAAAAAAVGLAIVLALFRSRRTVFADDINLLKW